MKNRLVKKKNDFIENIEGRWRLDLVQSKIIAYLASKTHKDDDDFKTYIFDIDQFYGDIGQKNHNYQHTIKSVKGIMSKVITIVTPKKLKLRNILSVADFDIETNQVELRFHEDVKPYFLNLKGKFTKYYLENVLKLSSKYSIRIYEYCIMRRGAYNTNCTINVSLEDFRKFLDLDPKTYKLFAHFNARVLKQSEKEINKHTDINIKINTKKKGKKVIGLIITVENKEKIKKKLKEKNPMAELIGIKEKTEAWYLKKIDLMEDMMYKQGNKLNSFKYRLKHENLIGFSDPEEQKLFKKTEYEVLCKKKDIEDLKAELVTLKEQ